jgi:phospholipase C
METYSAPNGLRRARWRLFLIAVSLCLISTHVFSEGPDRDSKLRRVKHIVVIYQENWSFDSLYGLFPGANGLAQSSPRSLNQTDRFDQPGIRITSTDHSTPTDQRRADRHTFHSWAQYAAAI